MVLIFKIYFCSRTSIIKKKRELERNLLFLIQIKILQLPKNTVLTVNVFTDTYMLLFSVELRRQLSKKGENNHEEIVEDEANVANSDDKEAIIEHLESRLNIAEEEHEAFTEKCKESCFQITNGRFTT